MTLNEPCPVFKVTPLFDAKYLTNDHKYGHSYYKRRIGNRTQAFEWHRYYSTSNNSKMVQDRAIIKMAD